MSNGSGIPPKGESELIDTMPQSRPLAPTAVDEGWFDVDWSLASAASNDASEQQVSPRIAPAPSPHPNSQQAMSPSDVGSAQSTHNETGLEASPSDVAATHSTHNDKSDVASTQTKQNETAPAVSPRHAAASGDEVSPEAATPPAASPLGAPPDSVPLEASRSIGSLIPQSLSPMVMPAANAQRSVPPTSTASASPSNHIEPKGVRPSTQLGAGLERSASKSSASKGIRHRDATPQMASGRDGKAGAVRSEGVDTAVSVESTNPFARVENAHMSDSEASFVAEERLPTKHWTASLGGANRARMVGAALSVGVVAAVAALVLARPKHHPKPVMLERLALPGSAAPPFATSQDPSKSNAPGLVSPPQPVSEGTPPLATVATPASSASAVGAPSSVVAAPAVGDSFADAFKKNAALKDAKWAELKDRSGKSDSAKSTTGKAMTDNPAAKKAAGPSNADPMDVLKRLEEARKNKRP